MANKKTTITPFLLVVLIFALSLFLTDWTNTTASANVRDDITAKQKQIEELERQIEEYQTQIDTTRSKSKTLKNEITGLNAKISQLNLEIKSMSLAINQTALEIGEAEGKIGQLENGISTHKNALARYLKIIYENDQKNLTEVILNNDSLSAFFSDLDGIRTTQDKLTVSVSEMKRLKSDISVQKEELEDKKFDMERLKKLQEIEKRTVDGNKKQKDGVLKETNGKQTKFQELVKKSQKDIAAIRDQIGYLIQTGVSAEEAVKYGQLAAIRVGIRPAFLIAILEIESGLGRNVGTGNWMDDMYNCYLRLGKSSRAETEKNAFLAIIGKLGLNADTVKVSREPNYGCGGALGPAQFLPSTWLAYEEEVARLTGHNPPNPWSIEDAFMASASKLVKGGAASKDKAGETAAAKAYISGNPKCTKTICNSYARMVLQKSVAIEQNL